MTAPTLVLLAVVLAGCVSAAPAPPPAPVSPPAALTPFSTPEVERDRAECLASGSLWMETARAYRCVGRESAL